MATTDRLRVELVHAWPERCWTQSLDLPAGACVGDALAAAAEDIAAQGLDLAKLGLAVFGHPVKPATALHSGDRIELLRPLLASPRQSRDLRAAAAKQRRP